MAKILFLIFAVLISISSLAGDKSENYFPGYPGIDSSKMLKRAGSFVVSSDKNVNYMIYYRNETEELSRLMSHHVAVSSKVFFDLARFRDLKVKSCEPVDHLQIFIVTLLELNNKSITRTITIQDNDYLVGLFDPVKDQPRTASIFIAAQEQENLNIKIISHEISHYWFYRLCWNTYEELNDEIYALVFGAFYAGLQKNK